MADKKKYDSEFCGSLPLHNINMIQDYGYLIVLDHRELSIIQMSENVQDLFGRPVQELVNSSLSEYIEKKDLDRIFTILQKGITEKIPLTLNLKIEAQIHPYHVLMHVKQDYVILELQKTQPDRTRSFTEVYQEIKHISLALEAATSVQEVCAIAVHEIRAISGLDGVLMYKFDKDWNGTVIAEEKDERLESYLGQSFPASDVPKQARALYLKNPYRLIPNRDYLQSKLYPVINPLSHAFIDLSDCNLRSVPAVHLEYMKNMGIKASMSIRVIKDHELWGLISCHHISTMYLDYEICAVFEWLSSLISSRISAILNKENYDMATLLQEKRLKLIDEVYAQNDIIQGLLHKPDLNILELFNARGAMVVLNNRIEVIGEVPEKDDLDNLLFWLEGKNVDTIFSTDHLSGLFDDAAAYTATGSGILVIPINTAEGEYIVCFRPEVVETINWGGDPNQAINFEKDNKTYHPRNSFKLWQQVVVHHALPWEQTVLDVAENLRNFLFEFRTKQGHN